MFENIRKMMSRTRSTCYLINQIIIIKQPECFPKPPDITHSPPPPTMLQGKPQTPTPSTTKQPTKSQGDRIPLLSLRLSPFRGSRSRSRLSERKSFRQGRKTNGKNPERGNGASSPLSQKSRIFKVLFLLK